MPCDPSQDLRVEVNWHELRILGIWAENWAQHCANKSGDGWDKSGKRMPAVVAAIARRLQSQHPDLSPLTLSAEIAALPADLAKAGIEVGAVETNVAKPPLIVINGTGAIGHVSR